MKVCCVESCSGPYDEETVFFEFPTSRLLRKRWLDAIDSSAKVPQDAVVCIRHFSRGDYELVRGKTRLKSRVVPSRRVGDKANEKSEDSDASQDSTITATSDIAAEKTNNKDSDNEKVHSDSENNGKVNNDNGKISNDNHEKEKVSNDSQEKENVSNGKENVGEDKNNSKNLFDPKNSNVDIENDHNNKDISNNTSKIVDNDNNRLDNNDSGKVDKDSGKVDNDSGKVDNDNGVDRNNEIVDNKKVQKSRKTRCKITAMRPIRKMNGRKVSTDSSNSDSISSSPPPIQEMEANKEDIEDALTNYYIENKKTERQVAAMTDVIQEDLDRRGEGKTDGEKGDGEKGDGEIPEEEFRPSEPVFIELSVGQGTNIDGQTENDCLMVLESVQCDVDPALLLAAREMDEEAEPVVIGDDDDDDNGGGDGETRVVKKKEDPISLLTSSDEDDVIIQEPKIDTVEVSSADTSEDDMPLVKLIKTPKSSKIRDKSVNSKRHNKLITKLLWGGHDFYCVHCRYTTVDPADFSTHMATHSKVLQLCQECGFTTCSKPQMVRHKQKHKNDRRYKCTSCNYSAKHEMSLVYHMRTHSKRNEVELAICDTFEPASKISKASGKSRTSEKSKASDNSGASEKSKASNSAQKRYKCAWCAYKTNRRSDLKRHQKRLHDHDDDDDDEFRP